VRQRLEFQIVTERGKLAGSALANAYLCHYEADYIKSVGTTFKKRVRAWQHRGTKPADKYVDRLCRQFKVTRDILSGLATMW
jgi:hypothetical protein